MKVEYRNLIARLGNWRESNRRTSSYSEKPEVHSNCSECVDFVSLGGARCVDEDRSPMVTLDIGCI